MSMKEESHGETLNKTRSFFSTDDIEAVKLGSCNISGVLDIQYLQYSGLFINIAIEICISFFSLSLLYPPPTRNSEIQLAINSDITIFPNS
jgi:hypothetical protein